MIIRPDSGKVARWGVLGLVVIFAVLAGNEFNTWFSDAPLTVISNTPISVGSAGALAIGVILISVSFYCTQMNATCVDFLVDVESEMAKVSWSSKKELLNGTLVVIILCFLFGGFIFLVDSGLTMLMDVIRKI